jgi:hypothetical protein
LGEIDEFLTSRPTFMQAVELARLAALVAATGDALALPGAAIPESALTEYWVANRQRFEMWDRGFARFAELEELGRVLAMREWWSSHLAMIEEILVSEILTRVMAAVGMMIDRRLETQGMEPLTHSVYLWHMEARNRVLKLLLFGRGSSVDETLRLNRLRRAAERWVDLLLAPLSMPHTDVLRYAIDAARATSLGADPRSGFFHAGGGMSLASWQSPLIDASLAGLCRTGVALPQANRQIGRAVLACLLPSQFDDWGRPRSLLSQRLLLANSPESPPGVSAAAGHPLLPVYPSSIARPGIIRWTS